MIKAAVAREILTNPRMQVVNGAFEITVPTEVCVFAAADCCLYAAFSYHAMLLSCVLAQVHLRC